MSGKVKDSPWAEYGYLIHLLRCAIFEEIPEELPDHLSFDKVYNYAMEHDVANLAFYAIEKLQEKPHTELYQRWKLRRDHALARDINQEFARQEIVGEMEARGIPYKELQGSVLKKLYPRTEYRTMSDLDFIVPQERLQECGEILSNLGYRCTNQGDYEIDGGRRPNIYVEFHTGYFTEDMAEYDVMGDAFGIMEGTEQDRINELYLYSVLHAAKHYFTCGCGIRRVLDMYYLDLHYGQKVDRIYVDSVLKKAGLQNFAISFSGLAQHWFGEGKGRNDEYSMEEAILGSGLHGTRENYIQSKLRHLQKESAFTFGTKVRYIFKRIFPGDKVMLDRYPFLKIWRIFYPFCWIHRIFSMIFGRNRRGSVRDLKMIIQAQKDHRKK